MDEYYPSPREQERLQKTFEVLPTDIHTGLEIGFRDFRMTNLLRQKVDLVSIDLPKKIKVEDTYKLAFADIQSLPFHDKTFDIVVCTEVLEHLSEQVLLQGIAELQRVSRKYILASVPYQQRVWNEMFKCAHCGFVCHSMEHLHCLDDKKLLTLFEGTTPEKINFIGTMPGYAPDWFYRLAKAVGNVWVDFNAGYCPNCQQSDKAVAPSPLGYVLQRLIWRLEQRATPRPAWVLVLLRVTA